MKLFADVLAELDAGRGVALATVIDTGGSTPRHPGARMAVTDDGRGLGTIGGGRIEQEVMAVAREVANGAPARRIRHHLVRDLAMCCGGAMELVVAPAAPMQGAIAAALTAWRRRAPALVTTGVEDGALTVTAVTADAVVDIVLLSAQAARLTTMAAAARVEGFIDRTVREAGSPRYRPAPSWWRRTAAPR